MKAMLKKAVKEQQHSIVKEEIIPTRNQLEIQDDYSAHDNNSDVDVDHFDEPEDQDENNSVIDLSSSGCCSWCHKQGPCALVDLESTSSATSGGRKIRKRFCSERCFGLHRRAMFKKSKRCEWCHAGLSDSDVSFGTSGLHFCSDSCRARFLAERNTKPVQPPAAVAQSSSPPLSSSANVQIQSGILNPHCRIATSPASMEQALWLSRATAMLRVEEERRKHEHLKQTLLKYAPQYAASGRTSKLPNLRAATSSASSSSASTSIQASNIQENKDNKAILHPLKRRRLSNGRAEAQIQPQKTVTSASKPPPPLILGPRPSDPRSLEANTRLTNTLVPPPTLLMPMPCFVPIPFPIPLLIPVPYDKFYKNEVSASNSGSEETMEDNTSSGEENNEQNRQRRRSLIMDKPLRNAER